MRLAHPPVSSRFFICAVLMLLLCPFPALGARRRRPPARRDPPSAAPQVQPEQVPEQLAKAWAAFYAGRYNEGVELSSALTGLSESPQRWAAIQAAHVQARCLWAKGDGRSRAQARQIWSALSRASTRNSLLARLKIAQALELEASVNPAGPPSGGANLDRAIGLLENILKENQPNTATPEAAIELGRLYGKAGRFDEAKKALDFAVALMRDERTAGQMEITDAQAKVYVDAGNAAIRQLAYARDAGRVEFEAAEKLYKQAERASGGAQARKYTEALEAYRKVARDFPDTEYGPRSELAVGRCLVGLRRPDLAAR